MSHYTPEEIRNAVAQERRLIDGNGPALAATEQWLDIIEQLLREIGSARVWLVHHCEGSEEFEPELSDLIRALAGGVEER